MSQIYRIIFDRQHGIWKVAGEHAKGQGKTPGRLARRTQTGRKMSPGQALAGSAYFALCLPRWVSVTMLTATEFEANSSGAISTDWAFKDQSILDTLAENAVSGGAQTF